MGTSSTGADRGGLLHPTTHTFGISLPPKLSAGRSRAALKMQEVLRYAARSQEGSAPVTPRGPGTTVG